MLGLVGCHQLVHLVKSARIFVVENGNEKCSFARRQVVRDDLAGKKLAEVIPGSFFQVSPSFEANELVLVVVIISPRRWGRSRMWRTSGLGRSPQSLALGRPTSNYQPSYLTSSRSCCGFCTAVCRSRRLRPQHQHLNQ